MIWIAVAFVSFNAIAQDRFLEGKNIISSETTFEVKYSEELLTVWNVRNIYPVPKPKGEYPPLSIRKGDMQVDTIQQKKILKEVLASKMTKLHQQREFISIRYVFGQDGKVINIVYSFLPNTMVTPKQLASIDKRLRKEVKATYRGIEYLEFPAIHFSQKFIFF